MIAQNNVSDKLCLTDECKRRIMTRYEKGDRNLENIEKKLNIHFLCFCIRMDAY